MISNLIKAPFPLLTSSKSKWITTISIALFVYLFLAIFKPYNLHLLIEDKQQLYILGYGVISFLIIAIAFFILPLLFPSFFLPDKWTVGKTIFYISLQLTFIAIGNWAYTKEISNSLPNVDHSLFQFFFITFSVGIFPCTFLILFLERKLREEKEGIANSMNSAILNASNDNKEVSQIIYSIGNTKQNILTSIDELLCIKSEGNYLEIYQWKEGKLIKNVIRFSLKQVKEILENEKDIHHCHRSFIVNFNYIEHVSGNARNYEITLKNLPLKIPISRSFSKDLLQFHLP